MPADADELTQAAHIHRRWRGLGALLFVAFYSFFFSLHLKLEKTDLYMKDMDWLGASTATFFSDMVLPQEHAGSKGTGKGSAFLLLHHFPTRILVAAWTPLAGGEGPARRHAVATMTASAGALAVVLMYLTLMWGGMGRLRAVLMASALGASASFMLMAVLPQPQIFSALGLVAVLAAVARGRARRAWEFPAAAFYAVCCSPWNLVPVLLMGLASWGSAFRGGGGFRPVLGMLGSALALMLLVFGAMQLQVWLYPRMAVPLPALVEGWQQTLAQAVNTSAGANWMEVARSVSMDGVVLRSMSPFIGFLIVWPLLIVLAILGLPAAVKRFATPVVAALLAFAWLVWFHVAQIKTLTLPLLWTPFLIFLVGVGLEPYARRWSWLRWPVTLLLAALPMLLMLHNSKIIDSIVNPQP